jgi:hypothetical protein
MSDVSSVDQLEQDRNAVSKITAQFGMDNRLAWRTRMIVNQNPYMANRPQAVLNLAQMPLSDNDLLSNVGQMYGMENASNMADDLKKYPPSMQRSIYSSLTPAQQGTLVQMGYEIPKADLNNSSWFDETLGNLAKPIGAVIGGVGKPLMKVVSPALQLIDTVSDTVMFRPYRTIRQLDDPMQILGLGAAVAGGIAAVALAPATFGASLGTLGTLAIAGAGAAVGASATTLAAQTLIGNPLDWTNAWSRAGNGERLFKDSGLQKAEDILGDSRLVNLAEQFASEMDDYSLLDIARDVAGTNQGLNPTAQVKEVIQVASKFADEGTAEHKKLVSGLTELLASPLFQEAVKTLVQSKISIGRDIAGVIGLDPDSDAYRWVSGGIDAATLIALDPFLIAGKFAHGWQFARRGLQWVDGTVAVERVRKVAQLPEMQRVFKEVASAVNDGNIRRLDLYAPWMKPAFDDLRQHKAILDDLAESGTIARQPDKVFDENDVVDWLVGQNNLKSVMSGTGIIKGAGEGTLRGLNKTQYAMRTAKGTVKEFFRGVDEVAAKKLGQGKTLAQKISVPSIGNTTPLQLQKIAVDNPSFYDDLVQDLPVEWQTNPHLIDALNPKAFETGTYFANIPGVKSLGAFVNAITKMVPGRYVKLVGAESMQEIENFVDLFRVAGVPDSVRHIWKKIILDAPDVGTRLNAISSMYRSFFDAAGLKLSDDVAEWADDLLKATKQSYSIGPNGRAVINGTETMRAVLPFADNAVAISIPDLQSIRKAARQGSIMRVMAGIPESTPIKAFQDKYWKPAVLLRYGFAVRNGMEDLAGWISRAGIGYMAQEFASRNLAKHELFDEAVTLARQGIKVSPQEEQALLRNFGIPAHMRPVQRIVEKIGVAGDPALLGLQHYNDWLYEKLANGFGSKTLNGWLKRIDELPTGGSGWAVGDKWLAPDTLKANFNSNIKALFLGNPYSSRRMMMGGVNVELLESAKSFQKVFGKSLMERIGTTNLLPGQKPITGEEFFQAQVGQKSKRGTGRIDFLHANGERTVVAVGGPKSRLLQDGHHAVLESVARLTDDEAGALALGYVQKVITKDILKDMSEQEILDLVLDWKILLSTIGSDEIGQDLFQIYRVLNESLEEPAVAAKRFQALVKQFELKNSHFVQPLMDLQKQFGGLRAPTWGDFQNVFGPWRKDTRRVGKVLEKFHALHIRNMSETSLKWTFANIHLDYVSNGRHLSRTEIERWKLETSRGLPATNEFNQIGPFYADRDTALASAKNDLLEKFNRGEGKYGELNQNREFIPTAPGTEVRVMLFPRLGTNPIDPTFLQGTLTDSLGNIDLDNLAFSVFGLDAATLNSSQLKALQGIGDQILNSILTRNELVLAGMNDAQIFRLRVLLDTAFKNAGYPGIPDIARARLMVSSNSTLTQAYPDIAERIHTLKTGPSGTDQVSVIGWDQNVYPLTRDYLDTATAQLGNETLVETLITAVRDRVTAGRRTVFHVVDNQTLYRNLNGKALQVPPGTIIDTTDTYFLDDKLSKPVELGNQRYIKSSAVSFDGNDEILWSIVSPISYDHAELVSGKMLEAPKNSTPVFVDGKYVDVSTEFDRLRTSSVRDVSKTSAGMLPDFEIAKVYEPKYTNAWDRFVQYGFNNVIGSSIDAIARRPMAFHAFHQARSRNIKSVEWLFRGTQAEATLNSRISILNGKKVFATAGPAQMQKFGDVGRLAGEAHAIEGFRHWSDREAFAYLKGFWNHSDPQQLDNLMNQIKAGVARGSEQFNDAQAKALVRWFERNNGNLAVTLPHDVDAFDFVDHIDAYFGEGSALLGKPITPNKLLNGGPNGPAMGLYRDLEIEDWDAIKKAAEAKKLAYTNAEEYAAEYAIRDIMPFIDSHEFRSQFADWARGYLPFWYAQENFLKRWAKTFTLDGAAGTFAQARKMQLAFTGLKTMGVIREDAQGKSHFVYPGSDLLIEAVSKIPGLNLLPVQAMLQSPADRMIPGFESNVAAAGVTPLLGMPLEFVQSLMPESQGMRDLQRALVGDMATTRSMWDYVVPASVKNSFGAITAYAGINDSKPNEKIASAMMAAMAQLEAVDQGLPDNATPGQIDDYIRTVRNHARTIMMAQALAGWFTPGPAVALQVNENQTSISWLTDGAITNPAELLSSTYYELIQELGIEEGTIRYLELYPDNRINDVVNPLAYTVAKSTTRSGAPLPSTEESISFYFDNKNLLDQYPEAGAWLLPASDSKEDRTKYAYDNEVIEGLRFSKTADEFLTELKFKEGANQYFTARQSYLDNYESLKDAGQKGKAATLKNAWDSWSAVFRAAHPVFNERLVSSDARTRRARTIDQMRLLINDPEVPQSPQFKGLRILMNSYDSYTVNKGSLGLNKSARGRATSEVLKQQFEQWTSNFLLEYPEINTFWMTVLRPETGLD